MINNTPPSNTSVTVLTTTTQVLAGNSGRSKVRIVNNDQSNRIWISEGAPAVIGQGECLFPAGDYERHGREGTFKGIINAIAENASCVVSVVEEYE